MSKIITENASTPAERLQLVVLKHFGTAATLAKQARMYPNNLSRYMTEKVPISKRFAMQMQDLAGVNANYLLAGEEPMMLPNAESLKSYPPIYEPMQKKISATQHGIAKQYILSDNGTRQEMVNSGEANIASLVYGEIDVNLPFIVYVVSPLFCETYKDYVGISDILIVKTAYSEGDVVLLVSDKQYFLADYKDRKFVDRVTDTPIEADENVKIIGAILKKITSTI
jgi:hypothetical protein